MNTQQIMKRRHVALIIIRCLALLLIVFGSVYMLWGIGTFLALGGLAGFFEQFGFVWNDNWNPFWFGFAVSLPGLVLALLDRRIVRWLVPLARHECPQCGYALRQLGSSRCPECGCELTASKD
jgi:hypothetical protein